MIDISHYKGSFIEPFNHLELYLDVLDEVKAKEFVFTVRCTDVEGMIIAPSRQWSYSESIGRHFVYSSHVKDRGLVHLPQIDLSGSAASIDFWIRPWPSGVSNNLRKTNPSACFGKLHVVSEAMNISSSHPYSNLKTLDAEVAE
ncbi:hypothetical protein ACX80Z_13790 [Arthrobacter sp. TMT4-20]